MTREEYLNELKSSIMSLSTDEQAEALQYYSDYFDEADDDEKVIRELGTPSELAKTIIEKFANALVDTKNGNNSDNSSETEESDDDSNGKRSIDALYYEFDKNQVKSLSVDFGAAEVMLIEGDKYSIETRGISKENLNCYLSKEGTLIVNNTRRFNIDFWSHERRSRVVPRFLMTIPKNSTLSKIRIAVGAGKLNSRKISLNCSSGNVDVGMGSIDVDGIYGGKIDMRCGMGNLHLKGSVTGVVNVDCGMGNVSLELNGKPEDYSYDAKVGLGDFRFNGEKKSGFCRIYNNQKLQNHFSVNCGMGSVNIQISQ